ncbi:MAG: PhoX family phosphatase [Oceanicaulis sp.]
MTIDRSEDLSVNPRANAGAPTFGDVLAERLSRRRFLAGAGAGAGLLATGCASTAEAGAENAARFDFPEIERATGPGIAAPEGYRADVLIRWGDGLFADSPAFDPMAQSADAQSRQFGYNNDYIGFIETERSGGRTVRGVLCVNHEYTNTVLMLPGVAEGYPASMTAALCATEQAAHGGSILEIALGEDGRWAPVAGSPVTRRIHARTPMVATGPAAGHPRLQTSADPTGRAISGTINNCAGGITPWGTYLMAEENFNGYFLGALPDGHPETANHARYGVPGGWYQWGRFEDRFDISREPNEPNRFGWVVEVDPLAPGAAPKKRTALGRFKHEGAESVVAPDGRVVLYMGDDQRFDYVYKFVTARAYDAENRAANRDLLDEGTLYVARFDADGTVVWLPLVFGEGPLTPANGFASQAEVLIETRRAADLLGATPMDRPEDVEPDPRSGKVYVMLTNNSRRGEDQTDAANPRANNRNGHIIEITEPAGDFTAMRSRWDIVVLCGDDASGATWNPMTSENGWFGSPDNCAVDGQGRLWVATDGNQDTGANDGVWALATEGAARGTGRAFFRAPDGAEVCGPRFTPDGRTLFVAVQHPGDTDGASFEAPGTRWPDFDDGTPPRPSVVAIRREDGGPVGG